MTEFFEVTQRDGPSRAGKIFLGGWRDTPLILLSKEEKWIGELSREFWISGKEFFELPPLKVSLSPDKDADLYIIPKANLLARDARAFIKTVLSFRKKIRPDSALYAPALATPSNLPLLIYSGIDLVDDVLCRMKGYMGIYLAPEGEYEIERIKSVPCVCCKNVKNKKEMFPILANHNLRELSREADRIRNLIMEGSMREYVESRRDIWNISALRLLDEEKEWMELLAPAARTSIFRVTSMESYRRAEVRRFMGRVLSRFSPKSKVFILFPCSARKPYSFSPSHRKFIRAIKDYRGSVQELIITSPLGVVPRELENVYPAAFYEIPVLGQWDAEEKKMISSCLSEFLEKNHPSHIIVHLDERYRKVCKDALENFEVKVTVSDSPTSSKSLELLKKTLDELVEKAPYKVKRIIESIADYQFGSGAGKLLDGKVLIRPLGIKGTAIINPYGLLSLTLEGARKLELLQRYQVEIDDFVPESSIFAPGVIDADPLIRVNDEVIVRGEKAFGCGRACMRGDEMVKSERGVAVKLRHVSVE